MNHNQMYQQRRKELVAAVKQAHPDKKGLIVLCGRFEHDRHKFRQDSTFYYMTGVTEPGAVLVMDLDGAATLYIPAFSGNRSQWVVNALKADIPTTQQFGFNQIAHLGKPQRGYVATPLITAEYYEQLIAVLAQTQTIFTCIPTDAHSYIEQRQLLEKIQRLLPQPIPLVDIATLIARMRRKKSRSEIEQMYKAVELTMVAQEAAARCISDGMREAQVQAGIEYIFTEAGATVAFPSIVGSGRYSTVLHYHENNHTMRDGDLVVVDIGAEVEYYCADLTRTYPVSGTFTKRQREVYQMVLDTQQFIAEKVRPGLWLNNKDKPQESLHHLAVNFLEKKGYAQHFVHGIGHFLGMDVHDVGNVMEPLQEGDVITIEPGIYISQERIGIRIEDDYWVVKDGVECLSEELPKSVREVEEMARASMADSFEENESEDELYEDEHEHDA